MKAATLGKSGGCGGYPPRPPGLRRGVIFLARPGLAARLTSRRRPR
ncbi:hypothetical protein HMPREF0731_4075, partial [Pseudoroseomonas cervicalis ATCC 49957]